MRSLSDIAQDLTAYTAAQRQAVKAQMDTLQAIADDLDGCYTERGPDEPWLKESEKVRSIVAMLIADLWELRHTYEGATLRAVNLTARLTGEGEE